MAVEADTAPIPARETPAAERPAAPRSGLRGFRRLFRSRRFKDYLPKSLFGRALLIIMLPIALMQIAVVWVFFDAHWQTVTLRLSEGVAGDVQVIIDLYEQSGGDLAAIQSEVSSTLGITPTLERGGKLPTTTNPSFFAPLDRTLRRALNTKLSHEFWFDTTRYKAYVEIRVKTGADVLWLIVPRDRVYATTGHIFLFWIVAATTFLTAVSIVYIRNQAKPIERLADAADRFGRGQEAPDFRPSGASEVRQAAHAFLRMRDRIERHIAQRTQLLAGVSHDLRTPLTRLRLQLALLPKSEEVDAMRADLADMQAILDEYLDFTKGMGGEEPAPTDLGALARAAAESATQPGVEIEVSVGDDLVLPVRAIALKRCLTNLVANAAGFASRIEVVARRANGSVEIDIDDDGPGIPPEQREEAFRPFSRFGEGRNGNAHGVGLGLSIARDVARGHGGDIELSESHLGGLRARVKLPAPAEL